MTFQSPIASPRVPEQAREIRAPACTPPTPPLATLHLNSNHSTPHAALKRACASSRDAAREKENAHKCADAPMTAAPTPTSAKLGTLRGVAFVSDGVRRLALGATRPDAIDDDINDDDINDGTDHERDDVTPRVARGADAVLYDVTFAIEKDTKPLAERMADIRRADVDGLREMFALAFGRSTSGKNVMWLRRCLRMRFRAIAARAEGATVKFTSKKASAAFVVCDRADDGNVEMRAPLKARKRKTMRDDDDDEHVSAPSMTHIGAMMKHTWIACPFAAKDSSSASSASAARAKKLPECANCRALSLLFDPEVPPLP